MRNRYGLRAVVVVLTLALVCGWGVAQIGPRYVLEVPGEAVASVVQGRVQLAGRGLVLISFQQLRILAVHVDAEAYSLEAARTWPAADLLLVLPAADGRYQGIAPLLALRDGMPVILSEPQAGAVAATAPMLAAATGAPQLYPMQVWESMEMRKRGARLRVTAMPGAAATAAAGVAGYLLEVGNSRASYRVYVSCAADRGTLLAQRLPGADLAVLPMPDAPRVLALNRGQPAGGEPTPLTATGYTFKVIRH